MIKLEKKIVSLEYALENLLIKKYGENTVSSHQVMGQNVKNYYIPVDDEKLGTLVCSITYTE